MGQPKADWKVERIAKVASALAGEAVSGDEVSIAEGMKAYFYVIQAIDRRDNQSLRNEIDLMNNMPRPVGDEPA